MKKKTIVTIVAGIAVLALAIVPAIAFYTAKTEKVRNKFSITEGDRRDDASEIFELEWKESLAQEMVPGMTVAKNPSLKSAVPYRAIGYMAVTIPQVEAAMNEEDIMEPCDSIELLEVSTAWRHVDTLPPVDDYPKVEIYCYNYPIDTDDMTQPLFNYIKVPDFDRCEGIEDFIDVTGYLVQAQAVDQTTADADATAYFTNYFQTDYKPPKYDD